MKRRSQSLEAQIESLLEREDLRAHELYEPLAELLERYREQAQQMERLTWISDRYQATAREEQQQLSDRYRRQMRRLQKIARISDHYQQMQRELAQRLHSSASQDALTGLPNRRHMLDQLRVQCLGMDRGENVFSLAILDVDHFKNINDRFGHDAGDQALIEVAHALRRSLRAEDVCARWGGEEFLLLWPGVGADEAMSFAEQIRRAVASLRVPGAPDDLRMTVSLGVAQHGGQPDAAATIKQADLALYEAKRAGRNCVMLGSAEAT